MMELLENSQDKRSTYIRLIGQMCTEPLRTTVISGSINDARTFVQFELERVQAER